MKTQSKKQLDKKREDIKKLLEKADNPREELYRLYKENLKEIIFNCVIEFIEHSQELAKTKKKITDFDAFKFIDEFVENRTVMTE